MVAIVAAGALLGIASPALAADPQITDISLDNNQVSPGETVTLQFKVKNPEDNDAAPPVLINITVSTNNPKLTCSGNPCSLTNASFNPDETKDYTAKLKLASNTVLQGDQQATITIQAGNQSAQQQLTLKAPEQAPQVPEISGKVLNLYDNTPVPTAIVYLSDANGTEFRTGTDKNGSFKFLSTTAKPIAPGVFAIKVTKDDWKDAARGDTAVAGQPFRNFTVKMGPLVTASPSASGAAVPTGTDQALNTDAGTNLSGDEAKGSGLSWTLIAIGGLLVALGIGAIALLLMRRKGDDDEEDENDAPRMRPTGGPTPRVGTPPRPGPGGPRRAAPEATSVMRRPEPVGARGADPTMITRSPLADMQRPPAGGAPSNEATMMHGRIPADDPYNTAPGRPAPPPAGGYGGGGYGSPAAPPPSGGYGGGYGAQPPPPAPGYGPPTSPGGYGGAGYVQPTSPSAYPAGEQSGYSAGGYGGYGDQPGSRSTPSYGANDPYAAPPPRSDSYGPDPYSSQGYGAAPDYGQSQYGSQPPAGRPDPYAPDSGGYGYDQPAGGYDQQPGHDDRYDPRQSRHSQRPPTPPSGERRSLDWLDD